MLPPDAGDDPETRLVTVVGAFIDMILETEQQQRTMLRLSLEPATTPEPAAAEEGSGDPVVRGGARPGTGAAHPSRGVDRLAVAVRSAVGIESLVWLVDVAGLSRAEAREVMLTSARALVRDAMSGDEAR